MKDRQLIAQCLINIIDVDNHYDHALFEGDDMYDALINYMRKTIPDKTDALNEFENHLQSKKPTIDKIVSGEDISIQDYNNLIEPIRILKRKYKF